MFNILIKIGIIVYSLFILMDIYNIFILKKEPIKLDENQILKNRKLYITYQFTMNITVLTWFILSGYGEKFSQISPYIEDIKYISLFICGIMTLFKKNIMENLISEVDSNGNLILKKKQPFNSDVFIKITILTIIFALGIYNYFIPIMRFKLKVLNVMAGIAIMSLPIISMVYSFKLNNGFIKTISLVLFITSSLISAIFILITIAGIGLTVGATYDSSFELIEKIESEVFMISTYRSNGGATTSYGITVRQEKKVLPGILLVKNIYRKYPKYDVEINIDGNHVFIDNEEYILKNNIYY